MSDSSSRRKILAAVGSSLPLLVAGCSSSTSGTETPTTTDTQTEAQNSEHPTTETRTKTENSQTETPQSQPFDGWMADANNYSDIVDLTDQDEITVTVGYDAETIFSFDPSAIKISPGSTVTWEWSGDGGNHNVVAKSGLFESKLFESSGQTFEYTFDQKGTYKYFCRPHKGTGMKGAVVVEE